MSPHSTFQHLLNIDKSLNLLPESESLIFPVYLIVFGIKTVISEAEEDILHAVVAFLFKRLFYSFIREEKKSKVNENFRRFVFLDFIVSEYIT